MDNIADRDRRFRNLELKVGVMTAVAAVGLVVVFVFMGMEKDLFTRKFDLDFIAPTGTGFIEGMPVKLSGFVVGKVKELELTASARVRVVAEVNMKYQGWLTLGTKARLIKEGFIGDAVVEFVPGPEGGVTLTDGDRVIYEKAAGLDEFVGEATPVLLEIKEIIEYANDPEGDLKVAIRNLRVVGEELGKAMAEITPAAAELGGFAASMNDPSGNFSTTLRSLKVLAEGLKGTREELDLTIRELRAAYGGEGEFMGRLNETLDKVEGAFENIEAITAELAPAMGDVGRIVSDVESFTARMPAMGEDVEQALGELNGILGDIKRATPHVEELLVEAEGVVSEGLGVIEGVKTSWPVEGMVEPPRRSGLVDLDSPMGEVGLPEGAVR